jgi:hypothetical protein
MSWVVSTAIRAASPWGPTVQCGWALKYNPLHIHPGRTMSRILVSLVLTGALLLAACEEAPIEWSAVTYPGTRDSLVVPRLTLPATTLCEQSVRVARGPNLLYATWWSVRPDSSAVLVVARSNDEGRTWTAPETADGNDRSTMGCRRPPPAMRFDPTNGNVYLSYFIVTPAGPGIFFTHSMNQGQIFHAPVVVLYGERPSLTDVAGEGDRVVVVYEDPNSSRGQVGIALSNTMGHLFEERIPVSQPEVNARDPRVWLKGSSIRVSWRESSVMETDARSRPAERVGIWE